MTSKNPRLKPVLKGSMGSSHQYYSNQSLGFLGRTIAIENATRVRFKDKMFDMKRDRNPTCLGADYDEYLVNDIQNERFDNSLENHNTKERKFLMLQEELEGLLTLFRNIFNHIGMMNLPFIASQRIV